LSFLDDFFDDFLDDFFDDWRIKQFDEISIDVMIYWHMKL